MTSRHATSDMMAHLGFSSSKANFEYFKRQKRPPYFALRHGSIRFAPESTTIGTPSRPTLADEAGRRSKSSGGGDGVGGVETDATAGSRRNGVLNEPPNIISRASSAPTAILPRRGSMQQPSPQKQSTTAIGTSSHLHHPAFGPEEDDTTASSDVVPTWRLKERMKTVGVCLVLALNIGTDPPDVNKITPCAKLQCWMDPTLISRAKAREKIGERLEAQYARWQQRAKLRYKRALDPTVDDVRSLCVTMRRHARAERLLLHYNGHGVPRPTANGEIWLFDKDHTQYIPLSVTDLRQWIGKPSILVLDCSGAGVLMPYLTAPLGMEQQAPPQQQGTATSSNIDPLDETERASRSVRDCIVLCPCAEGELLPMNPEFPADIFTSCLTTPIPIALRWFVHQNPLSMEGVDPESVDRIPGQLNDRKTPLGELNWIFTAVTDTIAWNVLSSPLFQRLFRQDLLVASMFRNFLLADRILRSLNCTPTSHPALPSTCNHPLWQAWDLAVETCLCQLMRDGLLQMDASSLISPTVDGTEIDFTGDASRPTLSHDSSQTDLITSSPNLPSTSHLSAGQQPHLPPVSNVTAPFFAEQLTAFEVWLEFASTRQERDGTSPNNIPEMESPEQLPVVLQVLLSQAHRVRALVLLKRFLDLGPYAVNLALSVGIFPYVLKLLNSHVDEYKHVLVGIWVKILGFDPSCQVDLVKDGALPHFIAHLNWGLGKSPKGASDVSESNGIGLVSGSPGSSPISSSRIENVERDAAEQRIMAAFILSTICLDYPLGQSECLRQNMHGCCAGLLASSGIGSSPEEENYEEKRALFQERFPPEFRTWICICLGNLCNDCPSAQVEIYGTGVFTHIIDRLEDDCPDVRAAAAYALGCLIGTCPAIDRNGGGPLSPPSSQSPMNVGMSTSEFNLSSIGLPANQPMNPLSGMGLPPHNVTLPWQQQQQHHNLTQPNLYNPIGDGSNGLNVYTHMPSQPPPQPSVFEDIRRFAFDIAVAKRLVEAAHDASPTVRYEVIMSLACLVDKYFPAFAAVADTSASKVDQNEEVSFSDEKKSALDNNEGREKSSLANLQSNAEHRTSRLDKKANSRERNVSDESYSSENSDLEENEDNDDNPNKSIPLPDAVDREKEEEFRNIWIMLRALQHDDPHPIVSTAANDVVSVVHEHMLMLKTKYMEFLQQKRISDITLNRQAANNPSSGNVKSCSDEKDIVKEPAYHRVQSMVSMSNMAPPSMLPPQYVSQSLTMSSDLKAVNQGTDFEVAGVPMPSPVMRSVSDQVATGGWSTVANAIEVGRRHPHADSISEFPIDNGNIAQPVGSNNRDNFQQQFKIQYSLPKSKFYSWKRKEFGLRDKNNYDSSMFSYLDDPLSPVGAMKAYRERRNEYIHEKGREISETFASLAPKPPESRDSRSTITLMSDFIDDEAAASAAEALEVETADKKRALRLSQSALLRNEGVEMTSMLRFHPYEPALVVCDSSNGISIWDVRNSSKVCAFKNGNQKMSRMSSVSWINEQSSSLLLTATDDGTVRLWDGIIENNGELCRKKPILSTAFFAAPELEAGQRGSGLVTEWQQFSGQLITGGNSTWIRCWDLGAEKCCNMFDRNSDACVTTLTTAWDYVSISGENDSYICKTSAGGYSGIGPNIIVAGYGDGSMKVFDTRSNHNGPSMSTNSGNKGNPGFQRSCNTQGTIEGTGRMRRRGKLMQYAEHTSWIVDTFFTGYGSRYEIVSGCVAGDVKFWDLRYSSSLRTLDVQRSPMTALALHPRIPLLATGSHAQFIKILTLDGDTLDVIRYHEDYVTQRIGPVSCLCFHPHKILLAAGATDEIVSLYAPRHSHKSF